MALPARLPRASTFAHATWSAHHELFSVATSSPCEFVDVTDWIATIVWRTGLECGHANIQTRHTTTGLVVNEHEPLLLEDLRRTLERVAPRLGGYAHDDFRRRRDVAPGERVNGFAHCQALVLPVSATVNVADGELCLGRWQRVFLVELDGPQQRELSVTLMGLRGSRRA